MESPAFHSRAQVAKDTGLAPEDGGEKAGKDKKPDGKLFCSTADTNSAEREAACEEK